MSDKPKHRWYQFSLKTLLVGMTLFGIFLGRFGYLLERARHHERESERIALLLVGKQEGRWASARVTYNPTPDLDRFEERISPERPMLFLVDDEMVNMLRVKDSETWRIGLYHRNLGTLYRNAIRQPWMPVREPPFPETTP